jgi:N-acetylneuraminic acid mutarotase
MKFKILIVLSFVSTVMFTSCNDDTTVMGNWVTESFFTGWERSNGTYFAFDSIGFWGMGRDDDDYLLDFWKYRAKDDSWSQVDSFPGTARAYNICVSTKSKGYVGLGYDGDVDLKDFWEYDPIADTWTQIGDFPGGARRYASAFSIGDDIYVGLGTMDNDKKYMNDFYKYSNGQWSTIKPLPGEKRRNANVVTLDGKAYVISGDHNKSLSDFWQYDPATDSWTQFAEINDEDTGNPAVARNDAAVFASQGNIYLVGGTSGNSVLSSVFEYNMADSIWTEKTSIETSVTRQGAGYFLIDGMGYVIGGHSGSRYLADFYKFEPWVEKNLDDNN